MPLNIKDPETERLVTEVTALTGESKTRAVRHALMERRDRLILARSGSRGDRMVQMLERRLWPRLSQGVRGEALSKADKESLLGYGPEGV